MDFSIRRFAGLPDTSAATVVDVAVEEGCWLFAAGADRMLVIECVSRMPIVCQLLAVEHR